MGRCTSFHIVALVVLGGGEIPRCNRRIGFISKADCGAVISSWGLVNISSSSSCPSIAALGVRFVLDQWTFLSQNTKGEEQGAIWGPSAQSRLLWVQ